LRDNVYQDWSVQNLVKNAGSFNKPTIFLITDSQFKEEVFLEDIDSLLNASEVPNLFTPDEKVEVIEVWIIYIKTFFSGINLADFVNFDEQLTKLRKMY